MSAPKLAILTPSIPSRAHLLTALCQEVAAQVGDLPVEHLVLIDNKRRSVGAKRQALMEIAQADYIAFVDDDDKIMPGYIRAILSAIESHPDVITFDQNAYFNGVLFEVSFGHGSPNNELVEGEFTQRAAWHVCVWRRGIAKLSHFPDINYGEDWAWAGPLNKLQLKEHHIKEVLHEYHYATEVSEAHPDNDQSDN